jgi:hypothetical protein
MKKPIAILILSLIFFTEHIYSQELLQNIRGSVTDQESMAPLPGATVIVEGSDPLIGTTTDVDGQFILRDVPVGRHTISVSYIGYEKIIIPEIMVSSAKETILRFTLNEEVSTLEEVVIKPKHEKGKPVNEMAMISARSFTVEETKRYPAAISDPARMAKNFAGVTGGDDAGNEIIIRGNSPTSMLWRLEGVEIPSPNHFAEEGYSSGFVSILSSNLVGNSDFLTGAFPGEYGNAIAGVFDINLRSGNNMKRETALQVGVLGTDISMEGPFKKGYGGSFLFNYRYSTLSIMENLGLIPGAGGIPEYQDLSFKINLPAGRAGVFALWGIGGKARSVDRNETDPSEWETYWDRIGFDYRTGMGATGITHTYFPDNASYIKSTLAFTGQQSGEKQEIYTPNGQAGENTLAWPEPYSESDYNKTNVKANVLYNRKVNSKFSFRTGITYTNMRYNMTAEGIDEAADYTWRSWIDQSGQTWMMQGFASAKYRFSRKLSATGGLHMLYFGLNKELSVEPRIAFKLNCSPTQSIGLAAGVHSRHNDLTTYYMQVPINENFYSTPNSDLKLRKAFHLVLSHDHMLSKDLRLLIEVYYQYLWDLPVAADTAYTFSSVNGNWDEQYIDSLVSDGIGRNFGIEMTLEKFFTNRFYFLITGSFFDSKYRASNGKWYNTRFNVNYATNFVGGKEFVVGKDKNNFIGLNLKLTWAGGMRDTPIDYEKSMEEGYSVIVQDERYELRHQDYFRTDFGISYRLNKRRVSHTFSLDIQNLTNHQNVMYEYYDPENGAIMKEYHLGILPVLNYKIEF